MEKIDFSDPAEVYTSTGAGMRNRIMKFRRFATGAEAIRFAMEGQDIKLLGGTVIEIRDSRLAAADIRELYNSSSYPLARAKTA